MYQDTIAAIATPPGEGGIGIVRISGPESGSIATHLFRSGRSLRSVNADTLESHRLYYGAVVDPADGRIVDEVMLVCMRGPRTYTREDSIEIYCHGGMLPVRATLQLCLKHGARMAEPGEFTLRAFLNGRIDLSQAEAVAGIVSARTSRSLDLAVAELRGRLSARLTPARDELVTILAYLDAAADFPDDEIPPLDLLPALERVHAELNDVLASARTGLLFREGVQIAIVGRPNVGKSSLLNQLLGEDRAIVTDIAGTTRDVITESINLHGMPLTLLDTAGIAETEDVIEQLGIARSRQALDRSSIVLFVIDRSRPLSRDDTSIAQSIHDRLTSGSVLVVFNKIDLPEHPDSRSILELLPGAPVVEVSARSSRGMDNLREALYAVALRQSGDAEEPALVTLRQLDALNRAASHISAARESNDLGVPLDLLAVDVRAALHAVGEITGEHVDEAVLNEIFSRFCIGK